MLYFNIIFGRNGEGFFLILLNNFKYFLIIFNNFKNIFIILFYFISIGFVLTKKEKEKKNIML